MSVSYAFAKRVLDPATADLDALILAAARELEADAVTPTVDLIAQRLHVPPHLVARRPAAAPYRVPTTRQRVYAALVALSDRHGRPPTVREIGDELGGRSKGNISYHLRLLVELGLVRNLGGARGYVPRRPARAEARR